MPRYKLGIINVDRIFSYWSSELCSMISCEPWWICCHPTTPFNVVLCSAVRKAGNIWNFSCGIIFKLGLTRHGEQIFMLSFLEEASLVMPITWQSLTQKVWCTNCLSCRSDFLLVSDLWGLSYLSWLRSLSSLTSLMCSEHFSVVTILVLKRDPFLVRGRCWCASLHREGIGSVRSRQGWCQLCECSCNLNESWWSAGVQGSNQVFWRKSWGEKMLCPVVVG